MADYSDSIQHILPDSDVVRARPSTLVQIFASGTETLVWEGTTDRAGNFEVDSLPTGKYDLRIDGVRRQTFHHVKADHVHGTDQTWVWHREVVSSDTDQTDDIPIFAPGIAGSIIRLTVTAHYLNTSANAKVHVIAGAGNGAAALTFSGASRWNYEIQPPGSVKHGFVHVDANPGVTIAADDIVTMGIDYIAATIQGVTLVAIFRPT